MLAIILKAFFVYWPLLGIAMLLMRLQVDYPLVGLGHELSELGRSIKDSAPANLIQYLISHVLVLRVKLFLLLLLKELCEVLEGGLRLK